MPRAVQYVLSVHEQVPSFDEQLQLAILEVIRLDCKQESANRPRYIRLVFELLTASAHSVKYEAATTLTGLTLNPAAIKGEYLIINYIRVLTVNTAAASCYIELAVKESDNNVKLIVLDRLEALRQKHEHVLDPLVMDILRVLSSPDLEVRRKAVNIALAMVTSRNVEEVVVFLKKQLQRTMVEEPRIRNHQCEHLFFHLQRTGDRHDTKYSSEGKTRRL